MRRDRYSHLRSPPEARTQALPIAAHHAGAELGELVGVERRAGVMRRLAALLGRETKGHRRVEGLERLHLAIEPALPARPIAVRPRQARAQMHDAQLLEPAHRI